MRARVGGGAAGRALGGHHGGRTVVGVVRRLLVVEDEPLLAALMGRALEEAGFEVLVRADELAARDAVDAFDPDAVLLDVHLASGPAGLHLAHVLSRTHPSVGILLMSRHEDLSAAGLDGWDLPAGSRFLPKDRLTDATVLIEAVESVLRGASMPEADGDGGPVGGDGPLDGLTHTQLGVLRLAAMGLTNAAIAARRGTTERNVEQRLQAVYAELGIPVDGEVNPRVEAVRRYVAAAGMPRDLGPLDDPDRSEASGSDALGTDLDGGHG